MKGRPSAEGRGGRGIAWSWLGTCTSRVQNSGVRVPRPPLARASDASKPQRERPAHEGVEYAWTRGSSCGRLNSNGTTSLLITVQRQVLDRHDGRRPRGVVFAMEFGRHGSEVAISSLLL